MSPTVSGLETLGHPGCSAVKGLNFHSQKLRRDNGDPGRRNRNAAMPHASRPAGTPSQHPSNARQGRPPLVHRRPTTPPATRLAGPSVRTGTITADERHQLVRELGFRMSGTQNPSPHVKHNAAMGHRLIYVTR